jgi:hypothetical protein
MVNQHVERVSRLSQVTAESDSGIPADTSSSLLNNSSNGSAWSTCVGILGNVSTAVPYGSTAPFADVPMGCIPHRARCMCADGQRSAFAWSLRLSTLL